MSTSSRATQDRVSKRPQSYPRKRAVAACQLCRTRRTKCDNLRPSCSACLSLGVECTTTSADYSSFDPASLQILDRLGVVEALIRSLPLRNNDEVEPRENAQLPGSTPSREAGIRICSALPTSVENLLKLPIFEKLPPSPMDLARSLESQSPGTVVSRQPAPQLHHVALADEPQEMNKLVDCYFAYAHIKNPVLSERQVRQAVAAVALNGIDWSLQSCLALLICAIGSLSGPLGPDSPLSGTPAYSRSRAYYAAAERRLGQLFSSDDLVSAQCLFLAGVYAMTVFEPRQALKLFLQALLTSEQLFMDALAEDRGSELSQDPLQALPPRQAIYWSSWKSVKELHSVMRYSSLKLDVTGQSPYPSFYPTPPSYGNSGKDGSEADSGHEMSWYFYLAEISLKRLTTRLCLEIDAMKEQCSSDAEFLRKWVAQVPLWEQGINEWIESLPAALSFSSPTKDDDICRFILRGHVLNAFETIYWPFTNLPFSNSSNSISEMGPHILQLLQKGMEVHNDQIHVNQPGFHHRHHGTFLMIQACTRSSLTLVAYALLGLEATQLSNHASIQMPPRWLEGVQSVLEVLQYWAAEMPILMKYHMVLENALATMGLDLHGNR